MKRALTGIASVGILAVTVAMESANAQVTRPYRAPTPYAEPGSQGAGWNGLSQGYGWNGLSQGYGWNGLGQGYGWNGLGARRVGTPPAR